MSDAHTTGEQVVVTPRRLEHGRVGESIQRADGVPKVKGEFLYASDLDAPGMLWGHTLRSPHAHAAITSTDLSEALAMPGVHAVLTHADVRGRRRTASSFPTSPCSRSTASATTASRWRSSPPTTRSRRGAPPSESASTTSRSSR